MAVPADNRTHQDPEHVARGRRALQRVEAARAETASTPYGEEEIPAGRYAAELVALRVRLLEEEPHPELSWEFLLLTDGYQGTRLWRHTPLRPDAVGTVRAELALCGLTLGDLDELMEAGERLAGTRLEILVLPQGPEYEIRLVRRLDRTGAERPVSTLDLLFGHDDPRLVRALVRREQLRKRLQLLDDEYLAVRPEWSESPLPDGTYEVWVGSTRPFLPPLAQWPRLSIAFAIVSGPCQWQGFRQELELSPEGLPLLKAFLEACGLKLEGLARLDEELEAAIGKTLRVRLQTRHGRQVLSVPRPDAAPGAAC